MTEPSLEIIEKLAEAMTRRAAEQDAEVRSAPEPRPLRQPTTPPKQPTIRRDIAPDDTPTTGTAIANSFYVDHEFGYPYGSLTMWDGTNWHGLGTLTAQDEQGIMQVAFASSRVEFSWGTNGNITQIRCWKFLT